MTNPTTILVTNCACCPFVQASEERSEPWYCDALQTQDGFRELPEQRIPGPHLPPPTWCPLRTADRLVTLRVP
jgi:hypothetical protein